MRQIATLDDIPIMTSLFTPNRFDDGDWKRTTCAPLIHSPPSPESAVETREREGGIKMTVSGRGVPHRLSVAMWAGFGMTMAPRELRDLRRHRPTHSFQGPDQITYIWPEPIDNSPLSTI